jgi:hypothetical protein
MDRSLDIDYTHRTSLPIRDTTDGSIFCVVDIYGWTARDVPPTADPSPPMLKVMARLGLDPDRYAPYSADKDVTESYHGNGRPLPHRAQGARGRND